ncbi:MAG: CoA transferase [Acidimicrobiales bacterium]
MRRPAAPRGVELVKELVAHVDILVENYSHGVMARRGMDYDTLAAINPRLIYASVSGFGQSGPLKHKTSFDFIAQAYSGVMHMTGDPEGRPRSWASAWATPTPACTPSPASATPSTAATAPGGACTLTSRWSTPSSTCRRPRCTPCR